MASAFLSLPPPWSFGSADLKANARRLLRRALVISALVHLAAVGVFRAALERFASTEEGAQVVLRPWHPPTKFMPPFHIIPPGWRPPADTPNKVGEFSPVPTTVDVNTIVGNLPSAEPGPIGADPRPGPSGPDNPGPPRDPGPQPTASGFIYADTPPVPTVAPRPLYPPWAKEAGIEGKVLVRVLVGADGIPKRAVVVSGPTGLTEGIESAVLRWRFKPGLMNGAPVECWVEIPISFRLGE
jgi:periplasmic protein TonB